MASFRSKLDRLNEMNMSLSWDTPAETRERVQFEMFELVEDLRAHAIRADAPYAIQELNLLCDVIGEAADHLDTKLIHETCYKLMFAVSDDLG